MNQTKLEDYVKVYKGALDKDTCDLTVSGLTTKDFNTHKFYYEGTNEYKSHEKELSNYFATGEEITHGAIMNYTWKTIAQYVGELQMEWWTGWQGYSYPKYNKYVPGTQMKEHCDHIKDMFQGERKGIPIITILGVLNNDYTGGEFVMFRDKIYKLEKGDIIIFPSNFLYPHRVNEVTSGTRYSYASWVW
jgi:hypothetical protein